MVNAFFNKRPQRAKALLFAGFSLILTIVIVALTAAPYQQTVTLQNQPVAITITPSQIIYPYQCVTLAWDTTQTTVRSVFLNGQRQADRQTRFCGYPFNQPHLRFYFNDNSRHSTTPTVPVFYHTALGLALLVGLIVCLLVAIYYSLGIEASLVLLMLVLSYWRMQMTVQIDLFADYAQHMRLAYQMVDLGYINIPHFLFHAVLLVLSALFPSINPTDWNTLILIAAYLIAAILAYLLIREMVGKTTQLNKRLIVAYLAIPLLFFVAPISLLSPRISWNIYPNLMHTPTLIFLEPFALGLAYCLALMLYQKPTRGVMILAAALAILGALAKPIYTLPLLAACLAMLILSLFKVWAIPRRALITSVIVPSIAVLAWQYALVYGPNAVQLYASNVPAGIKFEPLNLQLNYQHLSLSDLPLQWLGSVAFPFFVYLAYFRRSLHDKLLSLSWLAFLAAQSLTFLFVEYPYVHHGNLGRSGQITLLVLFAVSFGFFLRVNKTNLTQPKPRLDVRLIAGLILFVLHALPSLLAWLVML